MQRFHLYRTPENHICAVEEPSDWSSRVSQHDEFSRLSTSTVTAEDAIKAVLEAGGMVLRQGRRPWRSDTEQQCDNFPQAHCDCLSPEPG